MPTPDHRNRPDNRNRNNADNASFDYGPIGNRTPQTPGAQGGGALSNPLFSGDHVLENIAKGNGTLRRGAKGPAVRAVQSYLIACGYDLGSAGADGQWGKMTTAAVKTWQKANGLGNDGVIGKDTLGKMDITDPGSSPAPSPNNQRPGPNEPGGGLPTDFEQMWEGHPHNNADANDENTASSQVNEDQGWDPGQYANTCAVRLSIAFNKMGGDFKITRKKAAQAGLKPQRLPYSRKTGFYYILSAREMWEYCEYWCGKANVEFPSRGYYKDSEDFNRRYDEEIKKAVEGKRGIVAFNKIFGYSGTGHVDMFDGEKLSDAYNWYPSRQVKIWYM